MFDKVSTIDLLLILTYYIVFGVIWWQFDITLAVVVYTILAGITLYDIHGRNVE